MKVSFICLANSRKLQGRCVAGIKTDGSGWIRPVTKTNDGSIPENRCRVASEDLDIFDVVEVEISKARSAPNQPENWVLKGTPWMLVEKLKPYDALEKISSFISVKPTLFGDQSDRIDFEALRLRPADSSLTLVRPSNVSWSITQNFRGRRQTRAYFKLGPYSYDLAVTDIK